MLEKILEEIEKQKRYCLMIGNAKEYNRGALKMAEVIEDIIRKYMNDGWIPPARVSRKPKVFTM